MSSKRGANVSVTYDDSDGQNVKRRRVCVTYLWTRGAGGAESEQSGFVEAE